MKNALFVVIVLVLAAAGCGRKAADAPKAPTTAAPENPLLSEFNTPFGVPPFALIKDEHYLPAFAKGMADQKKEVEAIVSNPEPPSFANTVEALERSGALFTRVAAVFGNMTNSNTNDELQRIDTEIAPKLAQHRDDIALNPGLFARVKAVYADREKLNLPVEQARLLEETYKDFVRGGADLPADKQARFRKINEELSVLTVKFGENVLKENNAFELVIDKEEDLAGLPAAAVAGAAEAARERGKAAGWVFTLHRPSIIPFLQYSEKRGLREKLFKAYINRGSNGNALDNKAAAAKIAALRVERANLLGYTTHADYVLEENMAKTPGTVTDFLVKLWTPALERARAEAADLQAMIREEGGGFELQPWDWWYYAEKVKKTRYDLDDTALRPYFQLEKVRDGAFMVAN